MVSLNVEWLGMGQLCGDKKFDQIEIPSDNEVKTNTVLGEPKETVILVSEDGRKSLAAQAGSFLAWAARPARRSSNNRPCGTRVPRFSHPYSRTPVRHQPCRRGEISFFAAMNSTSASRVWMRSSASFASGASAMARSFSLRAPALARS